MTAKQTLCALRAMIATGSFALVLAVHAAGIYKWTDADGKVHFTDKPPPDVKAETMHTDNAPDPYTAERLNDFTKQADESAKKRAENKAAAAEKAKESAEMAAHCEKVRGELQGLLTSTRRQFINDQGEREFVDEQRRQDWIATARAEIAKNCS